MDSIDKFPQVKVMMDIRKPTKVAIRARCSDDKCPNRIRIDLQDESLLPILLATILRLSDKCTCGSKLKLDVQFEHTDGMKSQIIHIDKLKPGSV